MKIKSGILVGLACMGALLFWQLILPTKAHAATGINQELTFEGKIVNASGLNIADGTYNMEFKIYNAASGCTPSTGAGCTLAWTEDYLVGGDGGITTTSGTFVVNLGSVCAFTGGACTYSGGNSNTSIDWNTNPLYLSIQIGNTSSCTITTNFNSNCSGDGEMKSYILLTSTPYALNSNKLGGLSAASFGQLATVQTWTAANTFQPTTNVTGVTILQNSAGSPTADIFDVQTANNTNILQITGPSANTASVTLNPVGGASSLNLGTSNLNDTIQIGSTTLNSGTQIIAIGNNATSGGTTNITIGASGSASGTVTVQGTGITETISGSSDTVKTSTNSTKAVQIQNSSSANILNVDTLTTSNVLLNGDFEGGGTTSWAALSGATLTQTTTQAWQGNDSLSVATTTTANDGAKYSGYTLLASQQYTLSLYAKVSAGSISDFSIGRQDNTGTGQVDCLTSQTVTTSWTRFNCTFTTNGTINTNFIYVRKSGGSAETIFIDGVQLQTGASVTPFNAGGGIQLGGVVESPVALQNSSDSTTAFQVQNAAGTSNLLVADTTNTKIGIAGAPTSGGSTLQVTGDISLTTLDAANTSTFVCRNSSNQLATCSTTGSGAAFIQGGNSFGAQAVLGTNDNNSLAIRTNNNNRIVVDTSGNLQFQQASTVNILTTAGGANLTVQAGSANSGVTAGGNLILEGGQGNSGGGTGSVVVQSNNTNSTTAFQVQNRNTAIILNVDTATSNNLVVNTGFERSTSSWAAKGAATIAQDSTYQYQGNSDMQVTTTTAANDGASYNYTFTNTQQYTLSFYAKVASSTITDVNFGRQDNGSTDTDCATGQTFTTTWTRFTCNFTAGAQSGTPDFYIKKTGVAAETFYIDAVQLETGATATAFNAGGALQVLGIVNSPLSIQNKNDSTNAFQIQNAAGTSNLFVADTADTKLGIAATPTAAGSTLQVTGDISLTTLDAASNATYVCRNSSNQLATCNTTGNGAAFIQGGNSFGAQAVLGTNDGNSLAIRTNNNNRIVVDTSGNLTFQQTSTINNLAAASGTQLTVQGGASNSGTNVGGNLLLEGGAGASTGASGSVIVQSNVNNSSTAFQVQNATGASILLVDTTSSDATGSTLNFLKYPGFEAGSFSNAAAGWAGVSTGTLTQNSTKNLTYNGLYSAKVVSSGTGGGLHTGSFASTPGSGSYIVSFYAEISTSTIAGNLFTVQTTDSGTHTCTPSASVTINASGFTRLSCTVSPTASVTDLQITQTSGANTIYYDGVMMQSTTYNGATISSPTAYDIGQLQLRGIVSNPVVIANNADSVSEFQLQQYSGNAILTADSINNIITLGSGTTQTQLILGTKTSTDSITPGTTTCTNSGAVFYNSSDNQFRACRNGKLFNLISGVDVQTFTSTNTWTAPSGISTVLVLVCGGGGSGGGGLTAATSTVRGGGTGGGGAAMNQRLMAASDAGTSVSVTVATTTAGPAGNASGAAGGTSSFGSTVKSFGGGGGIVGQAATAEGGGTGGGWGQVGVNGTNSSQKGGDNGTANFPGNGGAGGGASTGAVGQAAEYGGGAAGGAAGTGAVGTNGAGALYGGGGGASGGGATAANVASNGGVGGNINLLGNGGGGTAGTGNNASNGTGGGAGPAGSTIGCGGGGGGGGGSGNGTGGAGGNGGVPGGGGGGGGGGITGGAGGSGAAGKVWVFSW